MLNWWSLPQFAWNKRLGCYCCCCMLNWWSACEIWMSCISWQVLKKKSYKNIFLKFMLNWWNPHGIWVPWVSCQVLKKKSYKNIFSQIHVKLMKRWARFVRLSTADKWNVVDQPTGQCLTASLFLLLSGKFDQRLDSQILCIWTKFKQFVMLSTTFMSL
jgi:hypothetical protein